ncbi:HIT family protein [Planococcus lenghuensis]|uniref:HIT family protein n=1 Tax=Planococcus lenghuensis TaxID=2213202 RepID=A0A1Q2KZH3_9BACL|nr:HIT family protein [Planococcus lenghuensis]AQQ53546.1 HIT family protein [Planococcus lenghuensis]
MKLTCIFCDYTAIPEQKIIFENDWCVFLQMPQDILEGSGVIIPKAHKETVFDLSEAEWKATYTLLEKVKPYLDSHFLPAGYSVGWNCYQVGGQSIPHAHLHVIPRYADEPFAGKGIRNWFKNEANRRPGQRAY